MPELVTPSAELMASFVEAMREGYSRDNLRPETAASIAEVEADPAAFLRKLLGPPGDITLPDGSKGKAVPSTALWLAEGREFLGAINIRHELNPNLEQVGGHIGYGMRPAAQGRGLATLMLAGALDWVRANLGLKRVLLTVSPSNAASIRVIEKNGGVWQDTLPHLWREGDQSMRWWIEL